MDKVVEKAATKADKVERRKESGSAQLGSQSKLRSIHYVNS